MKRLKSRATVLLVTILILVSMASSCKHNSDGGVTRKTTEPSGEETQYLDDLPETDQYDGEVIKALVVEQTVAVNFISEDPGSTATVLEASIYKCALQLHERFGITMNYTAMDGYASGYQMFVNQIIETTMAGGDGAYDIVMPAYWYGMTLAADYYYDLNKVENLDFSKPYWKTGFNDATEIAGVRYGAVGDYITGSYDSAYLVAFNPQMVAQYDLTSPYALFDNNMWTLENMFLLKSTVSHQDPTDETNNQYGVVLSRQMLDGFYTSSGLRFIDDRNGEYVITKYSEKAEDLYQRFYKYMHDDDDIYYAKSIAEAVDLFVSGKTLFACTALSTAQAMRNMEQEYRLIVYPKYDSAQQEYITPTSGCPIMAIPKTARDPELSGLVMEALSASHHKIVIPAYIDIVLEGQTAKDPRSAEMINLALDTRFLDFGFVHHNAIANIANFGIMMEGMYSSMSSWYDGVKKTYETALEKYIASYISGTMKE